MAASPASDSEAQQRRNRSAAAAAQAERPVALAKIYKRPLMRPGRIRYCLKAAKLYDGRLDGPMNLATQRALRRLRDDLQLKADDVAHDWAIHAVLWRQCRDRWTADGGALDRFGHATFAPRSVAAATTAAASAPAEAVRARLQTSSANDTATAIKTVPQAGACYTAEHRDLLSRTQGQPSKVPVCSGPCLPMPASMDRDDARAYERNNGFAWCKACVAIESPLTLDEITRIEQAGELTLCPVVRRLPRARPSEGATVMSDLMRGVRAIFRRDLRPAERHSGIALIVSLSTYTGQIVRPRAERDAAAVYALLTERLGFRSNRIIELKDPVLDELEGVFGRAGNPKGLLSERLKEGPGAPVFVYISGLGALNDGDGGAYLLPSDATWGRERSRGYPLEALYRNLTAMGAGPVTLVLETDFSSDPKGPLIQPNAPSTRNSPLPHLALRGLNVIAAGDHDQRLLECPDTGLSLFTRHLVAGLSGHADLAPVGNNDGSVDAAEAFVYAAERTSHIARRMVGVLQRPTMSQGRAHAIAKLGIPTKP